MINRLNIHIQAMNALLNVFFLVQMAYKSIIWYGAWVMWVISLAAGFFADGLPA
jgi:hypothetical protein